MRTTSTWLSYIKKVTKNNAQNKQFHRLKNVAVKTLKIIFTHLKTVISEEDSSPQRYRHPQPDKNHNELSLLTQPLHSASPYGSIRELQPSVEDHQHDRPEPTPE